MKITTSTIENKVRAIGGKKQVTIPLGEDVSDSHAEAAFALVMKHGLVPDMETVTCEEVNDWTLVWHV